MRRTLFIAIALAGCSKGPEADLPYVGQARSLAAEWGMVNDQAAKGQVSATYARTMREELRKQLQTTASSLTQPDSPYAREISALAHEPDDAASAELKAHSNRLKQIEDALESA